METIRAWGWEYLVASRGC